MTVLGGIGFTAPWILVALLALPVLWLILRAIPPAPVRRTASDAKLRRVLAACVDQVIEPAFDRCKTGDGVRDIFASRVRL